jgi:hypothetical protein
MRPEATDLGFHDVVTRTQGGKVTLTDYSLHMCKLFFHVRLPAPLDTDCVHLIDLVLCDCSNFAGPFTWSNSRLNLTILEDGKYQLSDDSVNFKVIFESGAFLMPYASEVEKYGQILGIWFSGRQYIDVDILKTMSLELPAKYIPIGEGEL